MFPIRLQRVLCRRYADTETRTHDDCPTVSLVLYPSFFFRDNKTCSCLVTNQITFVLMKINLFSPFVYFSFFELQMSYPKDESSLVNTLVVYPQCKKESRRRETFVQTFRKFLYQSVSSRLRIDKRKIEVVKSKIQRQQ